MEKEILNSVELDNMLTRLTFQLLEKCTDISQTRIIGIRRRGEFLAKRLKKMMEETKKTNIPIGSLDITLYRDDLTEISDFPTLHGTEIDFDVQGKNIILVDDVIYTGRTIRAAMDALTDYGRPNRIILVALIDRGHRELPIQPDFTGKAVPTSHDELIHVKLSEVDGFDSVSIQKHG